MRVQSDLDPVVEEGEERGQREGGNEDGDETELKHCKERKAFDKRYRGMVAGKLSEGLSDRVRDKIARSGELGVFVVILPISRYSWKSPSFSTSL